jgi:hypothetical protein
MSTDPKVPRKDYGTAQFTCTLRKSAYDELYRFFSYGRVDFSTCLRSAAQHGDYAGFLSGCNGSIFRQYRLDLLNCIRQDSHIELIINQLSQPRAILYQRKELGNGASAMNADIPPQNRASKHR